jgi:spore coat polysaccharide biosynthesis protein SpsF (cytidylyltransferase family)
LNDSKIEYIGANYPEDNLPYGINAEIFKVLSLDGAFNNALTDHDLEHVTPWIKRHSNCSGLSPKIPKKDKLFVNSKLNLTIDTYAEFEIMRDIFNKVSEPLDESWFKICQIALHNSQKSK